MINIGTIVTKDTIRIVVLILGSIFMLSGIYYSHLKRQLLKRLEEIQKAFKPEAPHISNLANSFSTGNLFKCYGKALINKKFANKRFPSLNADCLSPKTKTYLIRYHWTVCIGLFTLVTAYLLANIFIPDEFNALQRHHKWRGH